MIHPLRFGQVVLDNSITRLFDSPASGGQPTWPLYLRGAVALTHDAFDLLHTETGIDVHIAPAPVQQQSPASNDMPFTITLKQGDENTHAFEETLDINQREHVHTFMSTLLARAFQWARTLPPTDSAD